MLRPVRLALTTAAVLVPLAVATGSGAPPAPVAAPLVSDGPAPAARAAISGTIPPVVASSASDATQRTVLTETGAVDALDIPFTAVAAYQRAAAVVSQVDAACGLRWEVLAAVGRVESDHGRIGGSTLGADGTSTPRILGPVLDGSGPLAAVADSDAGGVDGDAQWDRAVGPMQFLPSTWTVVGVDADGDGTRSADDLDDAALGAAVYLCAGSDDLATAAGARSALLRYNPSSAYATRVLEVARAYEQGRGVASKDVPVETVVARQHPATPGAGGSAGKPAHHDRPGTAVFAVEHPAGGAKPGKPHPTTPDPTPVEPVLTDPEPTPDPTPTPEPVVLTGLLALCAGDVETWCVNDARLDLGDASYLAAPALADLDADGVVESNREEIAGLVGAQVTVVVVEGSDPARVVTINGAAYVDQQVAP